MKLIYATSIAFSNKLANRVQVQSMAREFQKKLGDDFCLGVNYKNVEDESIKIICFNSSKSYILAWRYLKFVKENNINYVYCREARLLFFIVLFNIIFFHLKLKFTYEIHSLLERNFLDKIIDKFLSNNIDNFIFVTKNLEDKYLKRYSVSQEKSFVSPDGVDLKIFDINLSKEEARRKLNLPLDKKILVYTGKFKTMGMDKGIGDILKALKILDGKNILFVAVGGSKDEIEYYCDFAKNNLVYEKVKFIGLSPQSDLAVYQKSADILLMPFPFNEHYAFYMSPLKMFEYMAAKRPIIASNLPSIREVLNEYNAVIVKPDDHNGLALAIKELLNSNERSLRVSEHAFMDVYKYSWEKRVENITKIIVG